MAIPGAAASLLGISTAASGSGASMLGAAGRFGPGPQFVASLLITGATQFAKRAIAGELHDPFPYGIENPMPPLDPVGMEWLTRHPASVEEMRAQYPMAYTLSYDAYGGPTIDAISGEIVVPATDPNWQQRMAARGQRQPPAPADVPPYIPPDRPDYGYGSEPTGGFKVASMSPLSLIGDLGGAIGGLIGGIGRAAIETAPIWTPFLPTPARQPYQGPVAMPISTGGPMSQYPTAMPGGAPIYLPGVTPALGLPFGDIAPTGSIPITPNPVTGALPSSVLAPYRTRCGNPAWTIYRKMGRPVAYAGDFAAERRVKRLARKAKRRVGGR
jgi:hypothetical protein